MFAIKGKGGAEVPYFNRPSTANNIKTPLLPWALIQARRFYISVWRCRKRGRITATSRGRKTGDIRRNTSKGLTAEKMVISYKRGKAQYVWTLKDGGYKAKRAVGHSGTMRPSRWKS